MITLTREEAQQVLETMQHARVFVTSREKIKQPEGSDLYDAAIETLRARLGAPEPEEKKYTEESCPVCGYYCLGKGGVNCIDKPKLCGINTAPPKREFIGLTDEEYEAMAEKYVTNYFFDTLKYAKAIEAKLKEKNHG
jgi:cytochrome c5